jgi:hypothetical protein
MPAKPSSARDAKVPNPLGITASHDKIALAIKLFRNCSEPSFPCRPSRAISCRESAKAVGIRQWSTRGKNVTDTVPENNDRVRPAECGGPLSGHTGFLVPLISRRDVGGLSSITCDAQTKAARFRAMKSGIDSGGSPVTFSTTSLVPANTPFW